MGLLDIPLETVGQIFGEFCEHCAGRKFLATSHGLEAQTTNPHTDSKSLSNLSRTCRVLRTVAQPILYHDIEPNNMYSLLRTLVVSPHLAARVRGLRIGKDTCLALEAPEKSVLEAAVSHLGITLATDQSEAKWADGWEWGTEPSWAIAELILGLVAPNLEALRYSTYANNPYMVVQRHLGGLLRQSSGRCVVSFPRLRRLWIGPYMSNRGMHLGGDGLQAFLTAAPQLEALTPQMCTSVGAGELSLANVRELMLDWGYLDADGLTRLIEECPKLECFEYKSSGDILSHQANEVLPGDVWRALRPRAGTLRSLSIAYSDGSYPLEHELSPREQMGSLVDFHLERLSVQPPTLTKTALGDKAAFHNSAELVKMLPRSLRVLTLMGDWPDCKFESPIQLVEAKRRGLFPNLVGVEVAATDEDIERVSAAFAEVGIKCKQYSCKLQEFPFSPPGDPFREYVQWPGY